MPVEWSSESHYMKEMKKWDAPKREGGHNRNGFEKFPMMLYHTQPHPISGKHEVAIDRDIISLDKTTVLLDAQAFNTSCQMVVNDEEQLQRAKKDGWCESQAEALEWRDNYLASMALEAAHRGHDDRNMSEKALAEADRIDRATPGHLGEIPEQPRVKRKYVRKAS